MQKDLTAKQKNTFKTIEKLSQVQVNINRIGCTTKRKNISTLNKDLTVKMIEVSMHKKFQKQHRLRNFKTIYVIV